MEAIHDPGRSSVSWVARLLQVLQPLSLRADRLAGMELFAGLRWADLEFVAERLQEAEVERGTRMTVQGRPSSRLWLITGVKRSCRPTHGRCGWRDMETPSA